MYIFKFIGTDAVDVFTHILRLGSIVGDFPDSVLYVSSYEDYQVFQPDVDIVVSERIRRSICKLDESNSFMFEKIGRVMQFRQDPFTYPKLLLRLRRSDNIESKVWEAIRLPGITGCEDYYKLAAPVFTLKVRELCDDVEVLSIRTCYRMDDEDHYRKKEILWSPSWVKSNPLCWSGSGYFVPNSIYNIISPHLDRRFWHIEELDKT